MSGDRARELFDALADLPPEEVAERLLAEPDTELRARVGRLLEHDRAAAADFLAPAVDQLGLTVAERRRTTPAPPGRLGRFYVLRQLGAGGMGVVYVGFDEQLDRKVALKLLSGSLAAREWLLREGQALARLGHPNVVAVYEAGEDQGRAFLAMELVDGPTLRAWLESPRAFSETLRLFIEAGRGLQAAHEAGLVHRDFKPDNVLVGPDGRARVLDFGIAALAATAEVRPPQAPPSDPRPLSALSPPLTAEGIIGTPAFMSPEQFRGERATAKSDQFAFAVSLYRAVYGTAPFPGDDAARLLKSVLAGAVQPPPRTAGVPDWLGPILLTALSTDPERRFASMTALLAAIQRHLPRDPELDPSVTRRERTLVAAGALAVALPLMAFASASGPTAFLSSHSRLVKIALLFVIVMLALSFAFRRRLTQNAYGMRLVSVFILTPAALLLHRLACWRLGVPVAQTMGSDLVVMGTAVAVAGLTVERWLLVPAGVMLTGLAVVMIDPSRAPVAVMMAGPISFALGVYFFRRR